MMTVGLGWKMMCPDNKEGLITDMVVYYDMPRYFIVLSESGNRYVFYQYTEDDNVPYEEWLVGEISHEDYYKLLNNEITLYDSFGLMKLVLFRDYFNDAYETEYINRSDIDNDSLPMQGNYFMD